MRESDRGTRRRVLGEPTLIKFPCCVPVGAVSPVNAPGRSFPKHRLKPIDRPFDGRGKSPGGREIPARLDMKELAES